MTIGDGAQDAHGSGHPEPVSPSPQPPATTSEARWRPTLAVVSGRPGSGKTTLARQIAQALECPLLSRDEINEGIFHTFHHDPTAARKDSVAKLTFDVFFRAIELLVTNQVSVVAEAAFQDHRWRIGLEPLIAIADMKIVHCDIDPELARQRILRRHREAPDTAGTRRAAQARTNRTESLAVQSFQELSLAVPTLRVTTTDGFEPGIDQIVQFVRGAPDDAWQRSPGIAAVSS